LLNNRSKDETTDATKAIYSNVFHNGIIDSEKVGLSNFAGTFGLVLFAS